MKKSEIKKLIKELIKEQRSGSAIPPNVNIHGSTLSGTYTAVVDSGGQKVNIKCPPGQQVVTVRPLQNSISVTNTPHNNPLAGRALGITGRGVTVGCHPITPVQGGMDRTPEIR